MSKSHAKILIPIFCFSLIFATSNCHHSNCYDLEDQNINSIETQEEITNNLENKKENLTEEEKINLALSEKELELFLKEFFMKYNSLNKNKCLQTIKTVAAELSIFMPILLSSYLFTRIATVSFNMYNGLIYKNAVDKKTPISLFPKSNDLFKELKSRWKSIAFDVKASFVKTYLVPFSIAIVIYLLIKGIYFWGEKKGELNFEQKLIGNFIKEKDFEQKLIANYIEGKKLKEYKELMSIKLTHLANS